MSLNTETNNDLRIIVIDDNPQIHQDFQKILHNTVDIEKAKLNELEKKLFESEEKQKTNTVESSAHLPNFDLSFASQGQEGVKIIRDTAANNKHFALAFVDIRMPPGWDGVETVQEIWKVDPWVQVVICTAYSDYSWDEMIDKLGISDNLLILKKPFDVVEVRQLASSLTTKWLLKSKLKEHIGNLEAAIKERTMALERSLALLKATLEATADGILVEDTDGKIIEYNLIYASMWQIPEEILKTSLTKNILEFGAKQLMDPEAYLNKIEYLNKNLEVEAVDELNFRDGRCFERYCKPHRVGNKVVGRVWSFRNITEQKKMHQELLFQATHDKLTNLPNRRLLYDRITQSIALSKRNNTIIPILLFDLDKFKEINDGFGHTAGDAVLKLVAKRISEIIRASDTLARLGGDEFVIVLNETDDPSQAETVAKKIIEVIEKPFKLLDREFSLTASVGISMFPKDGSIPEELVQKADNAMYSVKESGRNGFKFYQDNLSDRTLQRLVLENDLKIAIESDQLKLYYQPLIEITSGKVVGLETFIRWQHPKLGLLMPDEFMQIAEESGLMIAIGEWMLKKACLQNKQWQEAKYPPLKVAINISSTLFKYPFFHTVIENILKETGLDPKYLELELTESAIAENPILMREVLEKIKNIGVDLVINDFGTGYSSLAYLRQFPFNKIKIARAFIHDIDTNMNDATLVHTIIAMGNNLNLKVVAEGVENNEQVSLLNKYKCDQVQGDMYTGPVSSDKLSKFLDTYVSTPLPNQEDPSRTTKQ